MRQRTGVSNTREKRERESTNIYANEKKLRNIRLPPQARIPPIVPVATVSGLEEQVFSVGRILSKMRQGSPEEARGVFPRLLDWQLDCSST